MIFAPPLRSLEKRSDAGHVQFVLAPGLQQPQWRATAVSGRKAPRFFSPSSSARSISLAITSTVAAGDQSRSLSILGSGPERTFQAWRPLIGMLGKKIAYLGPSEEARIMKLVVNVIVAAINSSLGEALNLGRRSGLDWNAMIDVINDSAVASPYIASKVGKLKERDWSPAATVDVIAKDMDLALELGRKRGAFLPLTAVARQILAAVEGRGQGQLDMSCVAAFFE